MIDKQFNCQYAISTHDLSRSFGQLKAVDHLDLSVPTGVIFGFLGINGAGKTTTIKMLTGLLRPTAGTAVVQGYDVTTQPYEVKRRIGILLEEDCLYDRLTAKEYLEFVATVRGLSDQETRSRMEELLTSLSLVEKQNKLIGTYSKGMRRKLALAAALIHQPPLLILDEPFADIDPLAIYEIKKILGGLHAAGATILLSTHLLAVAQDSCDLAAIIHQGQLVAVGDLRALQGQAHLIATSSLEEVFVQLVQPTTPVEV
jgi:ABC-2 type transport system ATP-binding protein